MGNLKYLSRFRKLIEKISEQRDVPVKDIEEMIDYFFKTLKRYITDPRLPTIKITNFGTFLPSKRRIEWQIRKAIKSIREGRNVERSKLKIKHLWEIRRRLQAERQGVLTWKEWRDKEINNSYTKIKGDE